RPAGAVARRRRLPRPFPARRARCGPHRVAADRAAARASGGGHPTLRPRHFKASPAGPARPTFANTPQWFSFSGRRRPTRTARVRPDLAAASRARRRGRIRKGVSRSMKQKKGAVAEPRTTATRPGSARSVDPRQGEKLLPAMLLLFVGSGCAALIYEVVWF